MSQSNLANVIRYIENQEEHHKRVTFQDEYRAFLNAYGSSLTNDTFGINRDRNPFRVYTTFDIMDPRGSRCARTLG